MACRCLGLRGGAGEGWRYEIGGEIGVVLVSAVEVKELLGFGPILFPCSVSLAFKVEHLIFGKSLRGGDSRTLFLRLLELGAVGVDKSVVGLGLVEDLVGGRQSGVIRILSVKEFRLRITDIMPSSSSNLTARLTLWMLKPQIFARVVLFAIQPNLPAPRSKWSRWQYRIIESGVKLGFCRMSLGKATKPLDILLSADKGNSAGATL